MGMSARCVYATEKRGGLPTADEFYEGSNLPNCLGAVDGKHMRMCKPDDSGSLFFNYKNFFSTVLMALVYADYRFIVMHLVTASSLTL